MSYMGLNGQVLSFSNADKIRVWLFCNLKVNDPKQVEIFEIAI